MLLASGFLSGCDCAPCGAFCLLSAGRLPPNKPPPGRAGTFAGTAGLLPPDLSSIGRLPPVLPLLDVLLPDPPGLLPPKGLFGRAGLLGLLPELPAGLLPAGRLKPEPPPALPVLGVLPDPPAGLLLPKGLLGRAGLFGLLPELLPGLLPAGRLKPDPPPALPEVPPGLLPLPGLFGRGGLFGLLPELLPGLLLPNGLFGRGGLLVLLLLVLLPGGLVPVAALSSALRSLALRSELRLKLEFPPKGLLAPTPARGGGLFVLVELAGFGSLRFTGALPKPPVRGGSLRKGLAGAARLNGLAVPLVGRAGLSPSLSASSFSSKLSSL